MQTMSTIDQTGAVEAEDVLVSQLRSIKSFPNRARKEISACVVPQVKEPKDEAEKAAFKKGYEAGELAGKKAGYLEALQHLEIFIKKLNA